MTLDLYFLFVTTTILLGLIPGPNIAMIVANSIAYGPRYGLVSVAGTSSAMIPQLLLTILGATTLLTLMAELFEWVRWIGVAYLVYLGIRHLFFAKEEALVLRADELKRAYRKIYWRAFWVSMSNPKTLLFFGAFLPQFVTSQDNFLQQMLLLSATFLVVITLVDSVWALLAGKARGWLLRFSKLRNRIAGCFYLTAGLALALARKP